MPAEDIKKDFERRYPPHQNALERANNIIDAAEQLQMMVGQIEVTQLASFTSKMRGVTRSLEELRNAITARLKQLKRYTTRGEAE